MKILLLVIFNSSEIYDEMLLIQKTYIHTHSDIDVYFVTLDENLNEKVILKDDMIYVKGTESYINILFKTLRALQYIKNIKNTNYDFVVRSNISTIINLDNLYKYLSSVPKTNVYTGGKIETLLWNLQPYEICQERQESRNEYYGLKFIQGNAIIMSYDVIEKILNIEHNIVYDIVDDVKLGIIMRDHFSDIYNDISKIPQPIQVYNNYTEDVVFIRNFTGYVNIIHQIRYFASKIKTVEYPNFEKKIYITYKQINDSLIQIKNEWETLNPEYTVELYDDLRCLDFLHKYYGTKYCDIFNFIKDGAIKADFFRACIIYIYGGIYVDADIKPLVPFRYYVDDDIELMTCISYNFDFNSDDYNFNPQLIISKKYSEFMLKVIYSYENLYNETLCNDTSYDYWKWSICVLLKNYLKFKFNNNLNTFLINNKKYNFVLENILDKNTKIIYDFTNFKENQTMLVKHNNITVFCNFNNIIVFTNFGNKYLLK